MNIAELKKSFSENKIRPLYIFTGEEIAILNIYKNKLSEKFNGDTVYSDCLSDILQRLKSNSLIYKNKALFIFHEDKSILTSESIWDSLKSGSFQKGNVLLFVYESLDKRSKFYKSFSDYITSFDKLSTDILKKYVYKDLSLTEDRCEELILICQNNYNSLLLEIDKIKNVSAHFNIDNNSAYDMCLDNGAFYIPPDGEIFDLLNSILSRNITSTYWQFNKFIARGESPIVILSLLHNNLKAILQVKCATGLSNVSQVTGLTGFQIKNAQQFIKRYTESELINMIKLIRFCEKSIKQTGLLDLDNVLDVLFVKIF